MPDIGLDEASCPSRKASPGIDAAPSLSARRLSPSYCTRRNYCRLSWVGGIVGISPATSVVWLLGWFLKSTMTEVATTHATSPLVSDSWSHLSATDGCNFVAPDFSGVLSCACTRSFKESIALVAAPCRSRWFYLYFTLCLLCPFAAGLGSGVSPKLPFLLACRGVQAAA